MGKSLKNAVAPDDEALTELLSGVGHLVFLSIINLDKHEVTKFLPKETEECRVLSFDQPHFVPTTFCSLAVP